MNISDERHSRRQRNLVQPLMWCVLAGLTALFLVPATVAPPISIIAEIEPEQGILGEEIQVRIIIDGAGRIRRPVDLYLAVQTPDFRILGFPDWSDSLVPHYSGWQPSGREVIEARCRLPAEGPPGRYRLWVQLMAAGTLTPAARPCSQAFSAGDDCFAPWARGERP